MRPDGIMTWGRVLGVEGTGRNEPAGFGIGAGVRLQMVWAYRRFCRRGVTASVLRNRERFVSCVKGSCILPTAILPTQDWKWAYGGSPNHEG